MSVFERSVDPATDAHEATPSAFYETSPFAAASLYAGAARPVDLVAEPAQRTVTTPFAEALSTLGESDLAAEAFEALRAEFEDEEFMEALEALTDEAAARHLSAAGEWSHEAGALQLASTEAEQWMESVAAHADRVLGELEAQFAERSAEDVTGAEIEAVAGVSGPQLEGLTGPLDAQELFLGKLIGKVKKVVAGVGKLVKKGVQAVGKLVPLGKVFGFLRKLVRPLLQRVLQKAIGKLPGNVQPIATKLASRFAKPAAAPKAATDSAATPTPAPSATSAGTPDAAPEPAGSAAPAGDSAASPVTAEALAEDFDRLLAEAVLAPHETAAAEFLAEVEAEVAATPRSVEESPYEALDAARARLAQQLLEAEPQSTPVAEMEQFIPVVMAAMKLIKLGVKVIGRRKVVDFVAKLLATLIQPMVGPEPAKLVSRPVADAGLRLLGLEAEGVADGRLGAEALVAATEDTIREVMELPAESLENELLLEAAVQEAFAEAAARHFPAEVLRRDVVESEAEDERGIWVSLPRSAAPHFRYRKYSLVTPVMVTRPMARAVVFSTGETLEDQLLDAGAARWPVQAEAHHYELLPGGVAGHLAAFEADGGSSYHEGALEFEQLSPARPAPLPQPRPHPAARRSGPSHPAPDAPGTRLVRLRVPGLRLRRHRVFTLRLDLGDAKPQLRVHLHLGERRAHELVEHLARKQHVQVVSLVRRFTGPDVRTVMAGRLHHKLEKRGVVLREGAAARFAERLCEAMARTVATQLPQAAPALAAAAKEPAPGVTLTFVFTFADRHALARGDVADPTMRIHAGVHRG